jgi:hypothetical protein
MTLTQIQEEIALVKSQIAASGGVAGKSVDGVSVSYAVAELYKRLQYLEQLELKMLASRRTLRNIDISNGLTPMPPVSMPKPIPPGQCNHVPMTSQEVTDMINGVFAT